MEASIGSPHALDPLPLGNNPWGAGQGVKQPIAPHATDEAVPGEEVWGHTQQLSECFGPSAGSPSPTGVFLDMARFTPGLRHVTARLTHGKCKYTGAPCSHGTLTLPARTGRSLCSPTPLMRVTRGAVEGKLPHGIRLRTSSKIHSPVWTLRRGDYSIGSSPASSAPGHPCWSPRIAPRKSLRPRPTCSSLINIRSSLKAPSATCCDYGKSGLECRWRGLENRVAAR